MLAASRNYRIGESKMDIEKTYAAGVEKMAKEHDELEETKVGTLRAGNTGAIYGGNVIGKCARLTLLRYLGIRYELIADSKRLMFDAGLSNEDIWVKALEEGIKASGEPYTIRTEEDTPIKWQTSRGVDVTGRPDIVIGKEVDGKWTPVKGLELKLASSLWTCRDTGIMMEPKLMHLLQSAHYGWQLGIPFELWYTNRAEFAVGSGWEQKTFPAEKEMLTQNVEWAERKDKRTGKTVKYVKKVLQFRQGYETQWSDKGQLLYRPLLEGKELHFTTTPITTKGIEQYYEKVVDQAEEKKLAPRPQLLKPDGAKGNYSPCDYCPLKPICEKRETDYDGWLAMVQAHASGLKA